MDKPIVSYVVTVYNKAPYLHDLVRSILAQPVRPIEIVFSDDASDDGSDRLLDVIARDMSGDGVVVKVVREAVNAGPSSAVNAGIRETTGDWVHFIDADDVMVPDASMLLLDAAKQSGSDLVFGAKVKLGVANSGNATACQPARVYRDALHGLIRERLMGMRFLCSRELAAIGSDERIFVQDVSLAYRIAYHSTSLTVLDAPIVMTREVENSVSKHRLQEHADFLGAAALFMLEFDATPRVKARIVRRCLGRIRKMNATGKYVGWELMSAIGRPPSRVVPAILNEFLRLQDDAGLRVGRAFEDVLRLSR